MDTDTLRSLCNKNGISCRSSSGKLLSRSQLLKKIQRGGAEIALLEPLDEFDLQPCTSGARSHDVMSWDPLGALERLDRHGCDSLNHPSFLAFWADIESEVGMPLKIVCGTSALISGKTIASESGLKDGITILVSCSSATTATNRNRNYLATREAFLGFKHFIHIVDGVIYMCPKPSTGDYSFTTYCPTRRVGASIYDSTDSVSCCVSEALKYKKFALDEMRGRRECRIITKEALIAKLKRLVAKINTGSPPSIKDSTFSTEDLSE